MNNLSIFISACECNDIGTEYCDNFAVCHCNDGYEGQSCGQCEQGYYNSKTLLLRHEDDPNYPICSGKTIKPIRCI